MVLTRVYAVSDPTEAGDPSYLQGLRAAVSAAIDYGLEGIDSTDRNPPQIPPVLLVQARIAARSGIGLDTVLRRYFAGYTLIGDFLIDEAEDALAADTLRRLLRAQASVFDRLLAAVSEEYARESEARTGTLEERRRELVQKLLEGERLDALELAYDLDASHLGLVAKGRGSAEAIRELAGGLDRRLLLVRHREETAWAWLGGRSELDPDEIHRLSGAEMPPGVSLAMGEPGEGEEGWRLTHRQAKAALPVALRGAGSLVRYADVALLASILQDDLLATSLRRMYLAPLEADRDGGEVARETLRAYFASGRNVSSAAAALRVNRNTIANRVRAIEQAIGRPLASCATEFEAVLQFDQLTRPGGDGAFSSLLNPLAVG